MENESKFKTHETDANPMNATQYRTARERLGHTQSELATRLGVTRRTVINREAGRLITAEAELAISALELGENGKVKSKNHQLQVALSELIAACVSREPCYESTPAKQIEIMREPGAPDIERARLALTGKTARPPIS